jgi:hypothetical protein
VIDQDWIAEKLATLDREALVNRAFTALKGDFKMGSPTLAAFGDAHGGVPCSAMFEPDDYPELHGEMDQFLRNRAAQLVEDEIENLAFDLELEGEAIQIWRAMIVPGDWVDNGLGDGGIGVCWAFDPVGAVSHDGGGGDETCRDIKMHATVDFYDVDWPETIVLNAVDLDTVGEEYEIRLKPEATVQLLSISDQHTDEVLLDCAHRPRLVAVSEEGTLAKVMSR